MPEKRPNPEKLLARIKAEEQQEQRGKLKIYLGAAPGVGKTFAMLQDANNQRMQGLDVVLGVVETHGRSEIEALIKNIEAIPRQVVDYHGKELYEFDLDAALKRNPGLILMDEMAHTNAPGLRHAKRWQDIKELLDRGINVNTTLNVQHIESLNNVVSQIIHTNIKETVPDYMLEMAHTIELIDLPPEDLIKRLQDGKVYFPAQAEIARDNFFRKGNLIALRELALRVTAERVNAQVLLYRQGLGIKHVWPTKEKILVLVGYTDASAKIIRAARRLATSLQAEWTAVHVDSPRPKLTEEQRNIAIHNLRLAEQLGAQTRILTGLDIIKETMAFAREQNITKIVVGKRIRPRLRDFFLGNLADEIIRHSGEIDVYVITGDQEGIKTPRSHTISPRGISWLSYSRAIGIVGFVTLANTIFFQFVHASSLMMTYLLGVACIALFGEIGPAILSSILSVMAFDYFFIPPFYSLNFLNWQDSFTFFVTLIIAIIISNLTILTRRQADTARAAEQRTATLHSLSRQLASTRGVDKLLDTAVHFINDAFNCDVIALLPDENTLIARASYGAERTLNEKSTSIAQWVYDLGQAAGPGTNTLPYSEALYIPLLASQGPIGVLWVKPETKKYLLTPEQMHLLEACANQIALALEVDRMQEQTTQTELRTETDRLRNRLLQSVSHDLRVPLAAILGASSTLIEMVDDLSTTEIIKLGKDIYFEGEQLIRLINNLLQMTYLEAEAVHLQKKHYPLHDIVASVISTSSKKLGNRPINILIPTNLPEIPFDKVLIDGVFTNLLDNAIKFSPPNTPIDISAETRNHYVEISVEDRGPGIVPDEINRLFEKFYRGRLLSSERGIGLGLAICRSIVKAHGGEIWAENRPDGGAAFRFTLPIS